MRYTTCKGIKRKTHYCCDNCETELGSEVDCLFDYHGELLCEE